MFVKNIPVDSNMHPFMYAFLFEASSFKDEKLEDYRSYEDGKMHERYYYIELNLDIDFIILTYCLGGKVYKDKIKDKKFKKI